MQIEQFEEAGCIDPWKIAAVLRTSADEIAMTAGLGRAAPQRRELIQPVRAQRRLRELIEVLDKVEPRFGSELMACSWFDHSPCRASTGDPRCSLRARAGRSRCRHTLKRWMRASACEATRCGALSGEREQPVQIEMRFHVLGQFVERAVHRGRIGKAG